MQENTWAIRTAISEQLQHTAAAKVLAYKDVTQGTLTASITVASVAHLSTFADEVWDDIKARTGLHEHVRAPAAPFIVVRSQAMYREDSQVVVSSRDWNRTRKVSKPDEDRYTVIVCMKEMSLATGAIRMWPTAKAEEYNEIRNGIAVKGSRDLIGSPGTCFVLHHTMVHELLPCNHPNGQTLVFAIVAHGTEDAEDESRYFPYPQLNRALVADEEGTVRVKEAEGEVMEADVHDKKPQRECPVPQEAWEETRSLAAGHTDAALVKQYFIEQNREEATQLIKELHNIESNLLKWVIELGKVLVKLRGLTTASDFNAFLDSIGKQKRIASYAMKFVQLHHDEWRVSCLFMLLRRDAHKCNRAARVTCIGAVCEVRLGKSSLHRGGFTGTRTCAPFFDREVQEEQTEGSPNTRNIASVLSKSCGAQEEDEGEAEEESEEERSRRCGSRGHARR